MSDVVEKTLTALPGLFDSQTGAVKITNRLRQLIKSITELTSKHVRAGYLTSVCVLQKQMREIMVRAMYCEMLGYDASFTYIHAIKLAQQGGVLEKRVGYLAVSLFLNEGHELLLLLVNTVLKDLQSTNLIEACMALTVVAQVFPKDMIPAVLPLVEDKLSHPKEIIRRKAVLALYKFYLIAPNQVQHIHSNPDGYKDLTGSFVTILKQVLGGKLPVDFNYRNVPAPWLQLQLLRILSLLGKEDQRYRRAAMQTQAAAILYECVKAVYTIHPKAELLEKAARCIGNFVLSPKINLKYLGLKALTYVVQHDAKLALQHQMTIIECLDHTDFTIKRETLELLFRITNAQNVTVIVEKMLDFLHGCNDEHTIIHLVGKVADCYVPMKTLTFAPDNSWFIQTMNDVFSTGGDLLQQDVPNNFLRLLAEVKRLYAVDSYLTVLKGDASHLPQRFLQLMSWVLGEYAHLQESVDQREVIRLLTQLLDQRSVSSETRVWILSALTKISEGQPDLILDLAEGLSSSQDTVLRQQAQELRQLSQDSQLYEWVLPRGAPWDGMEVTGLIAYFFQKYVKFLIGSVYMVRLNINFMYHFSSSTLILEGVKRVWGKDGYLQQKETTAPPVDEPSAAVQPSGQQEAAERLEPQLEPSTQNQDKQQLASSLFVGLGAGSAMSLLGKSEAPPPRFRKKPRAYESSSSSSSGTSERSSDSSSRSSRSTTDSFLYGSLLEEEPATSISAFGHTPKSSTANGPAQNKDTKEDRRAKTSHILGGDMVIVLSLSSCRLFRDEALLLMIFISNCTETVIKDAYLITGNSTSVCHYALLMDDPHTNVSFTGTVSYQTQPGHTNTLPFSGTLSTADFIRPLVVTTEEYGKLWLSRSHDVKQNLKLLRYALQLHVVDIIGSEGIVACRLLSGAPCLLHCRVNGAALAMWLGSPHPALPDCLLYHCQRALAQTPR
uniref:Adaptor related protein complex 4 subunit epsilon 1 n=1 Tax=Sinocyclocheilus grahami TaxID=75366 RepID=A0A672SE89_SINGR